MRSIIIVLFVQILAMANIAYGSDENIWGGLSLGEKVAYIKGHSDSSVFLCISYGQYPDNAACIEAYGLNSRSGVEKILKNADSVYGNENYKKIPLYLSMPAIFSEANGAITPADFKKSLDALSTIYK